MSKIPKVIHFCWLSKDEYPELIQKCVASWKEKLPDYTIKIWNTDNFDINICQYTREAYEKEKYAFVSDYIRLYVLYNEGGIYLDSDIEVIKRFDELLDYNAFTCFENNHTVAAWIFGSEKGNPLFGELLDFYNNTPFILKNGECDLTPNTVVVTKLLTEKGLVLNGTRQDLENISVFPQDYFCPYDRATEEMNITDNTFCVHYFNGAWISPSMRNVKTKRKKVISRYGRFAGYVYYGVQVLIHEGPRQFLKEFLFFTKN
jgi:mannosyltransferase OCH1-like enzyme